MIKTYNDLQKNDSYELMYEEYLEKLKTMYEQLLSYITIKEDFKLFSLFLS